MNKVNSVGLKRIKEVIDKDKIPVSEFHLFNAMDISELHEFAGEELYVYSLAVTNNGKTMARKNKVKFQDVYLKDANRKDLFIVVFEEIDENGKLSGPKTLDVNIKGHSSIRHKGLSMRFYFDDK